MNSDRSQLRTGGSQTSRGILILANPARRNRARNPYNTLLSNALTALGCDVLEFTRRNAIFTRPDIVHIHWPQTTIIAKWHRAIRNFAWLVGLLAWQRLRGARIVWTAHNVHAHDQSRPRMEAVLMWCVTRLVHGLIFLSQSSRNDIVRAMINLDRKPYRIIPHGLYEIPADFELTVQAARAKFDLPSDKPIISFVGDIKPYKGLDVLLDAFTGLEPGRATLFVAGVFGVPGFFQAPPDYVAEQKARLDALRKQGHSVVVVERRLDDVEMLFAIRASDINVLPYRKITNSGLAMLVLGLRGRVLATDAPIFREMRGELGSEWVLLSEGGVDGEALMAALPDRRDSAAEARLDAFLEVRRWPAIAAETLSFFRALCGRGAEDAAGGLQRQNG